MKRLLGAALLVAVATAGRPAAAQVDEVGDLLSIETEAVVNRDGSMDVVETWEFDFREERNGGFRNFVPGVGDYEIVDFRVTEDGEPRDLAPGFDEPDFGSDVRWFGSEDHNKVTGRHTYEVTYTVEGAVNVFPDIAVLDWQFIGTGFDRLERVAIDITFPGDGTDLRAFGHGVLHGIIEPVGNEVALRVADNPGGQFVEARVTLPIEDFDVEPSGVPQLQAILTEEAAFAAAANEQRQEARAIFDARFAEEVDDGVPDECDGASGELEDLCAELEALVERAEPRVGQELDIDDADLLVDLIAARDDVDEEIDRLVRARNERVMNVAGPVVAVLGVGLWLAIWRRWGKEPDRPTDVGEYYREVPPETPAVIASLDDWGGVDSKAFAATLVDLAQRGWVTIAPEGDTHRFTRTQKTEGEPLRDYEASILWRLFPTGRYAVTQDELVAEAKTQRSVSASWMQGFRKQVQSDYEAQQYQEKHGFLPWLLGLLIMLVVDGVAVLAFAARAWIGGAVAVAAGLLLLVLMPLLRRRTVKGVRKSAEVQGLKKFLEDFSLVDDVPVGHLALYERYLVYAVALGVADRLIAGLRMRFPEMADDPGFAPWYGFAYASGGHGGGSGIDRLGELGSLDSFAGDFTRATAAAFSPPSSSSGGGGGFSSGGGGGGGGGGGSW